MNTNDTQRPWNDDYTGKQEMDDVGTLTDVIEEDANTEDEDLSRDIIYSG